MVSGAVLAVFRGISQGPGTVIMHLDLTKAFGTSTPWSFVAAQAAPMREPHAQENSPGEIALCLVHGVVPDCDGPRFLSLSRVRVNGWRNDIDNYHALEAKILFAGETAHRPLLVLTAKSVPSGDGDQLVSTFVLGYERRADRFVGLFANAVGKNNNQATRVVEAGKLAGDIVVAEPTDNAPYTYYITVYRQADAGPHVPLLHYRGRTEYGDGNPLPVIDSEMPEMLKRLHLWHDGDPLPVPPVLPPQCHSLELRRRVEWCR
jgi:hypothetical protein